MVGRAPALGHGQAVPADPVLELGQQSGLADPGLGAHHDHLTPAVLGLGPAVEQQGELLLAGDQRRQPFADRRLETGLDPDVADDAEDARLALVAVESGGPLVGALEEVLHQPLGRFADQDRARLGEADQLRRGAQDLALGQSLVHVRAAHGSDHPPGVDRDADLRLDVQRFPEAAAEGFDGLDQRQARAHGPQAVVLVGDRVAEVGQHAAAQALGEVAVERTDHLAADLLELGPQLVEDLRQLFRVDRRAVGLERHDLAAHHRELAPLDPRRRPVVRGAVALVEERTAGVLDDLPEVSADAQEEPLAPSRLAVVLFDGLLAAGQALVARQPVVPLPLRGREDHREDQQSALPLAFEEAPELHLAAVRGVEEGLAHQDQGDVARGDPLPDRVVPQAARTDPLVGPDLHPLVLFEAAEEPQQRVVPEVLGVLVAVADEDPDERRWSLVSCSVVTAGPSVAGGMAVVRGRDEAGQMASTPRGTGLQRAS